MMHRQQHRREEKKVSLSNNQLAPLHTENKYHSIYWLRPASQVIDHIWNIGAARVFFATHDLTTICAIFYVVLNALRLSNYFTFAHIYQMPVVLHVPFSQSTTFRDVSQMIIILIASTLNVNIRMSQTVSETPQNGHHNIPFKTKDTHTHTPGLPFCGSDLDYPP